MADVIIVQALLELYYTPRAIQVKANCQLICTPPPSKSVDKSLYASIAPPPVPAKVIQI